MTKDQMYVLRQLHIIDVGADCMLCDLLEFSAIIAADAQADAAIFVCVADRTQNIFRVSAARNSNHEVVIVQDRLQLLKKHIVVGDIVCICRYQTDILSQADAAKRSAGLQVDRLIPIRDVMLRSQCTAAIAEDNDLLAILPRGSDQPNRVVKGLDIQRLDCLRKAG